MKRSTERAIREVAYFLTPFVLILIFLGLLYIEGWILYGPYTSFSWWWPAYASENWRTMVILIITAVPTSILTFAYLKLVTKS